MICFFIAESVNNIQYNFRLIVCTRFHNDASSTVVPEKYSTKNKIRTDRPWQTTAKEAWLSLPVNSIARIYHHTDKKVDKSSKTNCLFLISRGRGSTPTGPSTGHNLRKTVVLQRFNIAG